MATNLEDIRKRLIREGELVRNDGAHSIKSVKEVLTDQLKPALEAMSASMAGFKGGLEKQTKLEKLRDEKQYKLEQFNSDEERKAYEKQHAEQIKLEQQIATEDAKQKRKDQIEAQRKDIKIFGKDGVLASTIKKTFSIIGRTLMFGIIGAVGYEVLAGAAEALIPKFFGRDVNLPTVFEGFEKAGQALSKITAGDWANFTDNILYLAQPLGQLALGYGAAKGAGAVVEGGLNIAGQYLTFKALANIISPQAGDAAGGLKKAGLTMKLVRGGIAGLIFAGLYNGLPALMDWWRSEESGGSMTAEQIAQVPLPLGSQIGGVAVSSLAGLAAPGGPYVKAAAVLGLLIGGTALKVTEYFKDADILPNKVEEIYREKIKADEQLDRYLEIRKKAVALGEDTTLIDKKIKEQEDLIAELGSAPKINAALADKSELLIEQEKSINDFREGKDQYLENRFKANKRAFGDKMFTDEEYELMAYNQYLEELQRRQDAFNTTQLQIDSTISLATKSIDEGGFGLRLSDLDYTRNFGLPGEYSKRSRVNQYTVEKDFERFKKENNIQFDGSFQDLMGEAMMETSRANLLSGNYTNSLLGIGGGTSVVPVQAPSYDNSNLSFIMGGNQSSTVTLQQFNAYRGGNAFSQVVQD